MSTIVQAFGAMPTLHPLYETASVISLFALRLHGRVALRLAALSAHALAVASALIEGGAVGPETMAWGVLNLSLNICMLACLVRGRAGPLSRAAGRVPLIRVSASALRRLRVGTAAKAETWTSDRLFF